MNTTSPNRKRNLKGFTLIEVIAVLVLLGILTAVAVPKYIDMASQARKRAIDAGISELNSREALTWGKDQLLGNDPGTTPVDTDLGDEYTFPDGELDEIFFQGESKDVVYTAATLEGPGFYKATE